MPFTPPFVVYAVLVTAIVIGNVVNDQNYRIRDRGEVKTRLVKFNETGTTQLTKERRDHLKKLADQGHFQSPSFKKLLAKVKPRSVRKTELENELMQAEARIKSPAALTVEIIEFLLIFTVPVYLLGWSIGWIIRGFRRVD